MTKPTLFALGVIAIVAASLGGLAAAPVASGLSAATTAPAYRLAADQTATPRGRGYGKQCEQACFKKYGDFVPCPKGETRMCHVELGQCVRACKRR